MHRFLVVTYPHLDLNPRYVGDFILLDIFQDINTLFLVVGQRVEMPVVTSSKYQDIPAESFGVLIGVGRVCFVHRDESACMHVSICICTLFLEKSKKKTTYMHALNKNQKTTPSIAIGIFVKLMFCHIAYMR